MKQLILIDGPEKSGKTSLGELLVQSAQQGWHWEHISAVHFDTDMFYATLPDHETATHAQAFSYVKAGAKAAMRNGKQQVILSDKMTPFERGYFVSLAKHFGYEIKKIFVTGSYAKTVQNVPHVEPETATTALDVVAA